MPETISHKRAKIKAAGEKGETELKLKGKKRLDAMTENKAIEIERSGTDNGLILAAKRLKISRKKQKILQVPQKDIGKAVKAMKKVNVSGTIKNMGGTKRRYIRKKK